MAYFFNILENMPAYLVLFEASKYFIAVHQLSESCGFKTRSIEERSISTFSQLDS